MHAEECFAGGFIGTDYNLLQDLTGHLPDEWRAFNKKFIPVLLEREPGKNRISAGLAVGNYGQFPEAFKHRTSSYVLMAMANSAWAR